MTLRRRISSAERALALRPGDYREIIVHGGLRDADAVDDPCGAAMDGEYLVRDAAEPPAGFLSRVRELARRSRAAWLIIGPPPPS